MNITKEHILGFLLGLISIIVLSYFSGYPPFKQTIHATEQRYVMPTPSESFAINYDDIRFSELQIEAVVINMQRNIYWLPEDRERMKYTSVKSIQDLASIQNYLQSLDVGDRLIKLKNIDLAVISKLTAICTKLAATETEDIDNPFTEFNELFAEYRKAHEEAISNAKPRGRFPQGFKIEEEELKLTFDQEDAIIYQNVVEQINNNNYVQAFNELVDLKKKYHGTPFENGIKLRLSDCHFGAELNNQDNAIFDPEKGLDLLTEILDSDKYSPILFDAFYKWRTQRQSFFYGMSNMSEIPNWQYNLKRWQAAQTIKMHLKNNPDDDWANAQLSLLLTLPNIGRGGLLGNDNLFFWNETHLKNTFPNKINKKSGYGHQDSKIKGAM